MFISPFISLRTIDERDKFPPQEVEATLSQIPQEVPGVQSRDRGEDEEEEEQGKKGQTSL